MVRRFFLASRTKSLVQRVIVDGDSTWIFTGIMLWLLTINEVFDCGERSHQGVGALESMVR